MISVVVALTGIIAAAGTLTACSGSSRSLEVAPKTSTSQPSEPGPTTDSDPLTPTTPRKCVAGQATVQRNVSYGPAALDIFPTAKRCGAPVLIFVHGGGYCCGDKTQIGEQVIRWANEQGYTFTRDDLLIADAQKPLALAGVMGGMPSGVGATTTAIFFESACDAANPEQYLFSDF